MLFGLSNASASFQSYIDKILAKRLVVFVIIYLHNIFIYIKNKGKGHVKAVRWVLDLLRINRLFANLKKCRFYQNKVCFLGYVVTIQEMAIEDGRIEAVKN